MIVIGVSGGVDSVVLLDKIMKNADPADVVVAHVDHGARDKSADDAKFVRGLSKKYGVIYEEAKLDLGADFSEEQGRVARYSFFEELKQKYNAEYVATAHHKDDVIETAIINLIRGTGRRGLSSLKNAPTIKRPLLGFFKDELIGYAQDRKLRWVEDSTNKNTKFLRNRVRLDLLPKLVDADPDFKNKILKLIDNQKSMNLEIDKLIDKILEIVWRKDQSSKALLQNMEVSILKELVLAKARNDFGEYYISSERLLSAADFIKKKETGKQFELNGRLSLFVEKSVIRIKSTI